MLVPPCGKNKIALYPRRTHGLPSRTFDEVFKQAAHSLFAVYGVCMTLDDFRHANCRRISTVTNNQLEVFGTLEYIEISGILDKRSIEIRTMYRKIMYRVHRVS